MIKSLKPRPIKNSPYFVKRGSFLLEYRKLHFLTLHSFTNKKKFSTKFYTGYITSSFGSSFCKFYQWYKNYPLKKFMGLKGIDNVKLSWWITLIPFIREPWTPGTIVYKGKTKIYCKILLYLINNLSTFKSLIYLFYIKICRIL